MKFIFTCLLLGVVLGGFGQQNTFKVRVFAPGGGYLSQLTQLNDGTYVGVGGIYPDPNSGSVFLYILKTDANGNVLASKAIDNLGNSNGYSLTKTTDGGFAVCGDFDGESAVVKFTSDLTPQWQKEFFYDSGYIVLKKILQNSDGGYMIMGSIANYNSTGSSDYLLKTDGAGNVLFAKRYFDYRTKQTLDMVATADGNFAFLGGTAYDNTDDSAYVVKIKPDGSVLWTSYLVSKGQILYPTAMAATSDGGVIITGDADTLKTGLYTDRLLMAKYTSAGALQWSKDIVTTNYIESYAITAIEDTDGGYLFAGELDKFTDLAHNNYDTSYGYIVKTNASGDILWTKTYEPSQDGYTYFANLIKTTDGSYAACGEGYFYNTPDDDYDDGSFIYKFNSNLQACNETVGSKGTAQNFGRSVSMNATITSVITDNQDIDVVLTDAGTVDNVCSSVLPLQLVSFNASLQNKTVAVQWSTANEVNTSYFIVERSKDAVSFNALQQVTAKGNSAGVQTYSINDLQPLPGTSYYRLKEVDKDGKTTYSSVVPLTVLNNGVIVISPNPVRDAIHVVMQSANNSRLTLQVVDMEGRILAVQPASVSAGRNEITIPAASLAKGVYVLKVIQNNATQTIRFVKE